MFKRLAAVSAIGCLTGCLSLCAQTPKNTLAFKRAEHLRHGINTSIWFAQAVNNYGVDRLRTFTTEDDLQLIAKLGFDHIRLSIDAVPLTAWQEGKWDGKPFMTELDRVVDAAIADKLAVIIDIHPEDAYKQRLLQGDNGVEAFNDLWRAVAAHFASKAPDAVFFELMNEPEQNDIYRWQGIQATVVDTIRTVDKTHTIIASGAHYSGLDDLLKLEPLADTNVIYTFHDYDPFPFTHQGATWTMSEMKTLRHVPYPATIQTIEPNLTQEQTLAGQLFVEKYGMDHWDAERVAHTIAFAEQWSKAHDVPVYCGEFGVHSLYVDEKSRETWLHDMRVTLDHDGIGWAMWDYQTNFGLVTKKNGKTEVNEGVLHALGLGQ